MHNSTIKLKAKRCSCGCGRDGFIFSKGMLKECWGRVYGKPLKRVSDKRMNEDFADESRSNLIAELDRVFSLYIRIKYSNSEGVVSCFTCEKEMHYKRIDNGHVISRSEIGLRYDELNNYPQCRSCNIEHEKNPQIFRNKLEKEKPGILEYLDNIAHTTNRLSTTDLKELLIEYRDKLRLVETKLQKK